MGGEKQLPESIPATSSRWINGTLFLSNRLEIGTSAAREDRLNQAAVWAGFRQNT